MNAKKQFLYSASLRARECWIDRELLSSHYKINTEMLPNFKWSIPNQQLLITNDN